MDSKDVLDSLAELLGAEVKESVEEDELAKTKFVSWDSPDINKLFKIDWESSQLFHVVSDLFHDEAIPQKIHIAGGAIVRHFLKTDIFKGDIDIFPSGHRSLEYLRKRFENRKGFTTGKFAYSFPYKLGMRETKVQIVFHEPRTIENRLKYFDFDHCRMAYEINGDFLTSQSAPLHVVMKTSSLGDVRSAPYSLLRTIKYKKLGFDMDNIMEELAKRISVENMSEEDIERYKAGDYK